ncbi:MAG: DUF2065 domain-containing protein [bacterium]|jgi:uncharacterized protein YjeT (DUF2065 family)|nr:DUF2065 domain-containing protein [Betaproteobacteria bacterium]
MDAGSALLLALALMLVLEGLLPFLAPRLWREAFAWLVALPDRQLRFIGLTSMLAGILLLSWVR